MTETSSLLTRHAEELRRHAGYIEATYPTTAWIMRRIADELKHSLDCSERILPVNPALKSEES